MHRMVCHTCNNKFYLDWLHIRSRTVADHSLASFYLLFPYHSIKKWSMIAPEPAAARANTIGQMSGSGFMLQFDFAMVQKPLDRIGPHPVLSASTVSRKRLISGSVSSGMVSFTFDLEFQVIDRLESVPCPLGRRSHCRLEVGPGNQALAVVQFHMDARCQDAAR